ncbi:MAG: hypothetical protein MJ252_08730 [archaeon]|nr:hypothetical protein [archaeon]
MKNIFFTLLSVFILFSLLEYSYPICTVGNCPPLQGYCFNDKCMCARNYMTVSNEYISNKAGINCNYKTKSKFIAFILEFFFPIGVGHLYTENITFAIIKFSLFAFFIFAFCFQLCCLKKPIGKCLIAISILFILDFASWLVLQIADITGYALGLYKDGNGVPLH